MRFVEGLATTRISKSGIWDIKASLKCPLYRCSKAKKRRSLLVQPEDWETYDDSSDFYNQSPTGFTDECEEELGTDHMYGSPRGFSLADYIIEDDEYIWSFVHFSMSAAIEDFEFIEKNPHRDSVGSYEMIELE